MATQCTVCAHRRRMEIDSRLALQVVNLSAIGREFKLSHDAVRRHRDKHLPSFLPAFAADAGVREPGTLRAEAERLYLTTLDALAKAEAGLVVRVDEDGTEHRRVGIQAVATLIREARNGLDILVKLSVASGGDAPAPEGVNPELDARIAAALDRVRERSQPVLDVAEVVAEDATVVAGESRGGGTHPGTWSGQTAPASSDVVGVSDSETPNSTPKPDLSPAVIERLDRIHKEPHWDGNAAATTEERRAAGYGDPLL